MKAQLEPPDQYGSKVNEVDAHKHRDGCQKQEYNSQNTLRRDVRDLARFMVSSKHLGIPVSLVAYDAYNLKINKRTLTSGLNSQNRTMETTIGIR